MLESLDRIAERLRQPPSISVEVDKIREQIAENKAVSGDLEKLQPLYETLRQRGEEMIGRSEGADKDISAKGRSRWFELLKLFLRTKYTQIDRRLCMETQRRCFYSILVAPVFYFFSSPCRPGFLSLCSAVQDKLDQMVFLWSDVQALQEEREAKLLDVMDLADKFWCDHCALIVTIKDSQDLLRKLEEPGVDPSVVKQQQEFVEVWKWRVLTKERQHEG